MNMGIPGEKPPKESPQTDTERSKTVEEIFRKYHKKLIEWCVYKLNGHKLSGYFISHNIRSDAEEIVSSLYQRFLASKVSVDLSRSEGEVVKYLNLALQGGIRDFIEKSKLEKRNPEGGFVSLEETSDDKEEEALSSELKQYFVNPKTEENRGAIEKALSTLELRDRKKADIIKKIYLERRTEQEVAKDYGDTRQNIQDQKIRALKEIRAIIKELSRS